MELLANKSGGNKMKKDLTELVFILDRSGSMTSLTEDTIGGFNSMIEKQKKVEGECLVSLVLFDDISEVIYDRVNLKDISVLTNKEYYARGCTALIDALGASIHHIGNVHKYARKEDVPEKTMFIITTDGLENASINYTADRVKAMIKCQREKYGWEFLFLGANIDAVETARKYGIREDRAVRFHNDHEGICLNYMVLSDALEGYRKNEDIEENWCEDIEADFANRKEKK